MMKISTQHVQELRRRTGAGMMECKTTLEEMDGDLAAAVAVLRERGIARAEQRTERVTREGQVGTYLHHNGKLAAMVELNCETDFVARTDDFRALLAQLAEHVAAMNPLAVERSGIAPEVVAHKQAELLAERAPAGLPSPQAMAEAAQQLEAFYRESALNEQSWVRDPSTTVGDLVRAVAGRVGENIHVRRFARFALSETRELSPVVS